MNKNDELELLKIIDCIPIIPKVQVVFVEDGFVELPKTLSEYFEQLGIVPKLEGNGKMLLDNFDSLTHKHGLNILGINRIVKFTEDKTYS